MKRLLRISLQRRVLKKMSSHVPQAFQVFFFLFIEGLSADLSKLKNKILKSSFSSKNIYEIVFKEKNLKIYAHTHTLTEETPNHKKKYYEENLMQIIRIQIEYLLRVSA